MVDPDDPDFVLMYLCGLGLETTGIRRYPRCAALWQGEHRCRCEDGHHAGHFADIGQGVRVQWTEPVFAAEARGDDAHDDAGVSYEARGASPEEAIAKAVAFRNESRRHHRSLGHLGEGGIRNV